MELTILIPVKDDIRIEKCIKSIDEKVEILVVLNNPSIEVCEIVKNMDVRTVYLEEASLSKAYNLGIEHATYNHVLLMDSDCTFEPGTIKKLYEGCKNYNLCKGQVCFCYDGIISKTIARVREFTTSDFCNAFSPPLVLNKKIKNIMGYYFNPNLKWEEDYEFNQRVTENKIEINWIKEAKIYHPKLTLKRDLKSAFNYGTGHAAGIEKGIFLKHNKNKKINQWQNIYIKKEKGRLALTYYKIWKLFYKIGIIFGRIYINGIK